MRRIVRWPIMILSLLFLTLATNSALGQSELSHFKAVECPSEVPDILMVDCGILIAPEDHDNFDGDTVELPVYILRSHNLEPAPDPVAFMTGLPGANALPALPILAESAILQDRDLIVLEQRGSGLSDPSLECEPTLLIDDAFPCLENLRKKGISLEQYTTKAMVADLEALRQALGYEEWNLFGNSYSTVIMLQAMDWHPTGIRSVVLDSVQLPTVNIYEEVASNYANALKRLFEECATDMACATAFPDLSQRFHSLVGRYNSDPIRIDIINPETGEDKKAEIDGDWLLAQTYDALYGEINWADPLGYWPLLISQLEEGHIELIRPWIIDPVVDWEEILTFGHYFSVMCQDHYPNADPDVLAEQAANYPNLNTWAENAFGRRICEAWNLSNESSLSKAPISSDIPTLLLSGTHDPVNSPSWAKTAAETLTISYHFEFPGKGNWVSATDPCAQMIVNSFLNDPESAPDSSCLNQDEEIGFVLPGAVHLEPGINRFQVDSQINRRNLPRLVILGFSLLMFGIEIVYFAIFIIRHLKSDPVINEAGQKVALIGHIMAVSASIIGLGFYFIFTQILEQLANTTPLILRFGLQAGYGSLFFAPFLVELLTAGILIIAFSTWIAGYWSPIQRSYFSLVTLAAVTYTSLMAYWGLLIH